jgi:ZIP family zinc transporter
MGASFVWGLLAGSSLIVGGLVALRWRIGLRALGLVMAFGAGVLISAVAFDLVQEGFEKSRWSGGVAIGLLVGSAVFFAGDVMIDRLGGGERKKARGHSSESPLAIVLGIVLDGIPESMVIGLTIHEDGAIGAAFLIAVFLSNVPEAVAATSGLVATGWARARILALWLGVTLISGLASLAGYSLFQDASQRTIAFVLAFAGGAILTMLADTMLPEAYEHGGKLTGILTTIGFTVAFGIQALD